MIIRNIINFFISKLPIPRVTVGVIDDVIEAMADPDTEDLLEHKVCYVALTRPKKKVERAEISKKDKQIYITRNDDQSKRCANAHVR